MARREGTLKLTSNFEPRVAAPLDARSKVATLAELTASGTFPYPYTGMEVYVTSEQKKYLLIGNDTTVAANWVEAGSGSGQAGKINATALETVSDIEEAEDGFYLCLTDSKVYQVDSGTAAEVEKEIDTCLITNELYEDNKATLDDMDIVFVITDVSDSATTDEILERIVALEEDTTVSGLASRVEALEEGSLGEGLEALGYLPLMSSIANGFDALTYAQAWCAEDAGGTDTNLPGPDAVAQTYTSHIQFVINGQKLMLCWGNARTYYNYNGTVTFPTSYAKIPLVLVSFVSESMRTLTFEDGAYGLKGNKISSITKNNFTVLPITASISEEITSICWMALGRVN